MALTFTKKHVARMVETLDGFEYDTAEDAAKAVLETALEIIKERAKFTVVAQISTKEGEPPGDKIALGWYATENQATTDALKLAFSAQTHEEARAWVLPIFNDTPNNWYVSRKKAKKAAEAIDGNYREAEVARRVQWFEDNPGKPVPLEWTVEVAYDNQTDACEACHGLGRVPEPGTPTRADLPPEQRWY